MSYTQFLCVSLCFFMLKIFPYHFVQGDEVEQELSKVLQRRNSDEPATELWAIKAHLCMWGLKISLWFFWPMWSDNGTGSRMWEYTVHHSSVHMELHSCRPVGLTPPFRCQKYNNGHMSIRIRSQSNGRRRHEFMNHIFYLHLEHLAPGCTFKKASWWRQCDTLNNVLLGNLGPCLPCECYFGTYQLPAGTCCWRSHTPFTYTYTLLPPQSKEGALTRNPNSSDLSPINHLRGVLDKQVSSMETASHSLQDLNDLLLKSWCQIPQHTLRGLEESMPRQVRVGLAGAGGATQY